MNARAGRSQRSAALESVRTVDHLPPSYLARRSAESAPLSASPECSGQATQGSPPGEWAMVPGPPPRAEAAEGTRTRAEPSSAWTSHWGVGALSPYHVAQGTLSAPTLRSMYKPGRRRSGATRSCAGALGSPRKSRGRTRRAPVASSVQPTHAVSEVATICGWVALASPPLILCSGPRGSTPDRTRAQRSRIVLCPPARSRGSPAEWPLR